MRPDAGQRPRALWPGLLACAAILAALAVHLVSRVGAFDDAYIIFRYVENLARGRGLVYNAGERVFGISCPLYAGWVVLLRTLLPGAPLPQTAVHANAFLHAAGAAAAWLLMRHLGFAPWARGLAAASVALSEGILRASMGGMESPLYAALCLGALAATAARRDATALLLAALASLTRPEGILLLGVVVAARLLERGARRPEARWWLALLPLALWIAGSLLYYGSPIPHSVIAKARPLYPLPAGFTLEAILRSTGRWTLDGLVSVGLTAARAVAGYRMTAPVPAPLYLLAGPAITLWSLHRWWAGGTDRSLRRLALPVYLGLLILFFGVSNPLLLPWYLPLVQAPWLLVVIGAGWPARPAPGDRVARPVLLVLTLTTAFASFAAGIGPSSQSLTSHGGTNARQAAQLDAYARSAAWLDGNARPAESVAAAEIGVLGYLLDRRILDACGLVTPEAIPFLPVRPEERGAQLGPIPTDFVRATQPDYVVTLPAFAERSLLASDWFRGRYELAREEPFLEEEPLYRAVLIFRRRPFVLP